MWDLHRYLGGDPLEQGLWPLQATLAVWTEIIHLEYHTFMVRWALSEGRQFIGTMCICALCRPPLDGEAAQAAPLWPEQILPPPPENFDAIVPAQVPEPEGVIPESPYMPELHVPGPSVPTQGGEAPSTSGDENDRTSTYDILKSICNMNISSEPNPATAAPKVEFPPNNFTPTEVKPEVIEHELRMPALVPMHPQTIQRENCSPPHRAQSPDHGWPNYQAYEVIHHDPDALRTVLRPLH